MDRRTRWTAGECLCTLKSDYRTHFQTFFIHKVSFWCESLFFAYAKAGFFSDVKEGFYAADKEFDDHT